MDLPIERENHAMIAYHGIIYLIGGKNNRQRTICTGILISIFIGIRYEARANDPENPEPMNENSINSINLNSYKLVTNRVWKTLSHPKTNYDRSGCAAIVLGKYIYIIGGHTTVNNDHEVAIETKCVERFDPKNNLIEKCFNIEADIGCMDVDCCLVDVDMNENESFSIDSLFYENTPLW